jgi:hypothetical protein
MTELDDLRKRIQFLQQQSKEFFELNPQVPTVISDKHYLLEVAGIEYQQRVTYEEAIMFCFCMGAGWRLPTSDELLFIFVNRPKLKNEDENWDYWTCSSIHEDTNIRTFSVPNKQYTPIHIDYSNDWYDSYTQSLEFFNRDDTIITINYDRWCMNKNSDTSRTEVLFPVRDIQ